MTRGEPKIGPVTASPMARPRLRRNHREMITGQVTAWLTPDAPREMTTKKRKNVTIPVVKPRPTKPTPEMTALQKINARAEAVEQKANSGTDDAGFQLAERQG